MRALIEQVKIRAAESLVAALGGSVLSVLVVIENYLVDWLAPMPRDLLLWQVRFMIGLLAAIFLLIFIIVWYRPNLRFDSKAGTWIDLKTDIRYCAFCRADKKLGPMRNEARGWRCMVCRQFFGDPERKPEPKPPTDRGPQSWMG